MAWAEQLPSKGWRGGYRDPAGRKCYVTQPGGVAFVRKSDAREAAEDAAAKARRQASVEQGTQSARMHWGDWWDLRAAKRRQDTDTSSTEHYIVERHLRPFWGKVPLNRIAQRAVQNWVDDDLAPGLSAAYQRRIYTVFQGSVTAAVKKGILVASPCVGIKLPVVRKRPRPYMDDDYLGGLGDKLDDRYRDLAEFARLTGLRPGELCGLHANRVDLKTGWVEVVEVYVTRQKVIRPWPKDGDSRRVPLTAKAIEIVRRRLEGRSLTGGCGLRHTDGAKCRSALVFLSPWGTPVSPRNYYMQLLRAAEKAERPVLGPYTGRRAFATIAADGGLDPFAIGRLMGHAGIEVTADYVQETPAARARFLAAMGEVSPLSVVGQNEDRGADDGADLARNPVDDTGLSNDEDTG